MEKRKRNLKKRQKEKYQKSPTTKKNLQNLQKRNQEHEWTCSLPLNFLFTFINSYNKAHINNVKE